MSRHFPECDTCANQDVDPVSCDSCVRADNYEPKLDEDEELTFISLDDFKAMFPSRRSKK